MTRGRAMETGDDGRWEMETMERATSEAPAFAGDARERERGKEKSSRFRYTACIC